jgi:3-oxoacid CoA-transferase B subunit
MDDKTLIAKRVALEMKEGNLVNLGIGLPTTVPRYLPPGVEVYFQSENGIIGMAPVPGQGMEDPSLTDAGGGFVGAIPGAASIDSCLSFGLIRGGHLDITVLGGLEVDERGQLANWMVPGKMVPGMGGAMDLVTGAIGYFQDVIGFGRRIAMLAVGYGPSEEPGGAEVARWMRTVLPDLTIDWWPVPDPSWIPRT